MKQCNKKCQAVINTARPHVGSQRHRHAYMMWIPCHVEACDLTRAPATWFKSSRKRLRSCKNPGHDVASQTSPKFLAATTGVLQLHGYLLFVICYLLFVICYLLFVCVCVCVCVLGRPNKPMCGFVQTLMADVRMSGCMRKANDDTTVVHTTLCTWHTHHEHTIYVHDAHAVQIVHCTSVRPDRPTATAREAVMATVREIMRARGQRGPRGRRRGGGGKQFGWDGARPGLDARPPSIAMARQNQSA